MNTSSIHLPEDVIKVILLKCPVKSVIRFKSVSKSWHSTISDPRFSRILQSKRSENLKNKFFMWERPWQVIDGCYLPVRGSLYFISLEEDGKFRREPVSGFPSPEFIPMYSCNGLILLEADSNRTILWNPLIGKHIELPPFNSVTRPDVFYYDSTTDDYKIVTAFHHGYAEYSCKNGSWDDVKHFPDNFYFSPYDYCYFDGCFYVKWADEIKYFDTRDGKEKDLTPPDDVKSLTGVDLCEFSERLCLYELSEDRRRLQLWMLEKNGSFENRWRKLISMEKEEGDLYDLYPYCLSNEGFVFLRCKIRGEENDGHYNFKYFMYNPHDKSFHKYEFDWLLGFDYYPYSETLYMPSSNVLV